MSKEVVLCVSNAYQKKYYLNENFNGLPQTIRDELKIMCVLYTDCLLYTSDAADE